jgi:CRP-like cAMP-binding protein
MDELLAIFQKVFHPFPEKTIRMFSEEFKPRELNKGDHFLEEGNGCKHLAFIMKGAMMCYYIRDGKRYIDEFSLDYEFITDYSSFLTQAPSNKNIQCIEDTLLYTISFEKLNALYKTNDPAFEKLGRTMAEQLYLVWHEKSKSLLMDSASERYTKLIANRSHLPRRVPQYLIAEYLGITPESLSRIRKALFD